MSPTGISKAAYDKVTEEVVLGTDAVEKAVDVMIDKATAKVYELKEVASKEALDQVDELKDTVASAIKAKTKEIVTEAMNKLITDFYSKIDSIYYKDDKVISFKTDNESEAEEAEVDVEEIKEKLKDMVRESSKKASEYTESLYDPDTAAIYNSLPAILSILENEIIKEIDRTDFSDDSLTKMAILEKLILKLEMSLDDYIVKLMDYLDKKIADYAKPIITKYNEKIETLIENTSEEAKEKIGETLVEATTKYMNKSFGALEGKMKFKDETLVGKDISKSDGYKELISFGYSDYLRLFLFTKLIIKEEDVLLRVSDIIQLNINNSEELGHYKKGSFSMNTAYTYVELEAEITIDPLLVDLSFIQKVLKKVTEEETDLNKIYYHSVQGY